MIGSCQTVPVNQLAGPRREGTDPHALISMSGLHVSAPATEGLSRGGVKAVLGCPLPG
jgi:hypothetical protein